ncbi:hypothetical protein [Methanolobus sp. WCC5]
MEAFCKVSFGGKTSIGTDTRAQPETSAAPNNTPRSPRCLLFDLPDGLR